MLTGACWVVVWTFLVFGQQHTHTGTARDAAIEATRDALGIWQLYAEKYPTIPLLSLGIQRADCPEGETPEPY